MGFAFWAGLPWALKMPLGHLVDIIWRFKAVLVYLGAAMVALSLSIMFALVSYPQEMGKMMSLEAWYVISVILAPCGYVLQDAVADAHSVEAVPRFDNEGNKLSEESASAASISAAVTSSGRSSKVSSPAFACSS